MQMNANKNPQAQTDTAFEQGPKPQTNAEHLHLLLRQGGSQKMSAKLRLHSTHTHTTLEIVQEKTKA